MLVRYHIVFYTALLFHISTVTWEKKTHKPQRRNLRYPFGKRKGDAKVKSITRCNSCMCWVCSESFSVKISGPNQRGGRRGSNKTEGEGREGRRKDAGEG